MTLRIAFSVNIDGRGKGRPKFTSRGSFVTVYTDSKTRAYEATIKAAASVAMAGRPPLEGPVVLLVRVRRPIPKSTSKRVRAAMLADEMRPVTKPDVDNYAKAVLDALNKVAYLDDAQVVDQRTIKTFSNLPGVDIVVKEWAPLAAPEERDA